MPIRIAVVDPRPDLLEFLKERLELHGYEVVTALAEDELTHVTPAPDLVLVDFEPIVDLVEVFGSIEYGLRQARRKAPRKS